MTPDDRSVTPSLSKQRLKAQTPYFDFGTRANHKQLNEQRLNENRLRLIDVVSRCVHSRVSKSLRRQQTVNSVDFSRQLKNMAYSGSNRAPEVANLVVAKKVDLNNYLEDVQREAENKAMTFLQGLDKDT